MFTDTAAIDVAAAREEITKVVERFGANHRANLPGSQSGCVYSKMVDGVLTPVCIVGQVFANWGLLGLLLVDFREPVDPDTGDLSQFGTCILGEPMWERLRALGVKVTDDAVHFFRDAQSAQDAGYTWGFSLAYAEFRVGERARVAALEALTGEPPRLSERVDSPERFGEMTGRLDEDGKEFGSL